MTTERSISPGDMEMHLEQASCFPFQCRGRGDNQFGDPTIICSKKLRKNKQAPSNDATKDDWLISIDNYLDTTDKPQIQRIPSLLREKQSNKNCYDPLVVSIGPYHHGNPELEEFEKLKIPIAQKFIRACGNQLPAKQLYEEVVKVGESLRKCYEKGSTKEYDDESFNKMMFLDACFVLYFILYICPNTEGTDMKQNDADLQHRWSYFFVSVRRDLLLLENQLPLLVLKVLMKFLSKSKGPDLETELIQNFLDQMPIMTPQEYSCNNAIEKFLAQMMGCGVQENGEWKTKMNARPRHLLHLVREELIGSCPDAKNKEKFDKWNSYRSVMELKSAGIHFRPSQTNRVIDILALCHTFA
ncbi:Hypothetical predicted protein [Olea europaea subsp. europaea]|uniref:Uncharacterized protein n=1 Tax=Olea europaea subsp. europaea TaxID=158383 RepID=A0A8S0R2M9_OLEEU|nr:Hypothetical predicted protein [Olea europaea subsp. europaea]